MSKDIQKGEGVPVETTVGLRPATPRAPRCGVFGLRPHALALVAVAAMCSCGPKPEDDSALIANECGEVRDWSYVVRGDGQEACRVTLWVPSLGKYYVIDVPKQYGEKLPYQKQLCVDDNWTIDQ